MEHRKLKVEELGRLSVSDFRRAKPMPLIVVLDNVRSLYNIGSVFRTADAYRVEGVWLCGISCAPSDAAQRAEAESDVAQSFFETRGGRATYREVHKTALGAELSVPSR